MEMAEPVQADQKTTRKEGKTITHSNAGVLSPTHISYQLTTDQFQAFPLPPNAVPFTASWLIWPW